MITTIYGENNTENGWRRRKNKALEILYVEQ